MPSYPDDPTMGDSARSYERTRTLENPVPRNQRATHTPGSPTLTDRLEGLQAAVEECGSLIGQIESRLFGPYPLDTLPKGHGGVEKLEAHNGVEATVQITAKLLSNLRERLEHISSRT